MVADIAELEILDASECKRNNVQKKDSILISPVADGTAKLSGRDFEVRESLYGRSNLFRVKISEPTDETKDDAEARIDFWPMEGDFIDRHHVEPPFQLNVLKEDTFPIPLKYIDVTRTAHTNLDVLQESRIDDS